MPALVSASSNGSTAVEFSGQTTRSGAGHLAGLDLLGEVDGGVDVVLGDLPVVVEDVVAVAGDVALDRGHGDLAVGVAVHGTTAGTASSATSPARQSAATRRLPSPATGPATSQASRAPSRASRKLTPTAPA